MHTHTGGDADQYQKMTATPIPGLIVRLGIPTTLSMLVTNLYNMVDTWFVGQIGTSASGATGVVFALMAIIQAVGFMFGHGAGSNISRALGAQQVEKARQFSSTAFFLALGVSGSITVLGLLFLEPLCLLLGSTATILPFARTYAMFILLAAPGLACSCVVNNIMRYEGFAAAAMVGLVSGSVLNMVLDGVLIWGFGLGIAGAGLATMLSQYVSAGILFYMSRHSGMKTVFALRYFHPKRELVAKIVTVGFPSLLRQGLGSASTMLLNWQAKVYGDAAVAAMSIVARVTNLLFCVGLGIGQGFQPVAGFNYGAKLYSRVRSAFWFTWGLGTCLMLVLAALGYLFAVPVVAAMRDDAQVIAIGVTALRWQCMALPLMAISVCVNMLFQSTGNSRPASFVAALRSGLCFVPLLLVLPYCFGLAGIQMAQPLADAAAAAISLPMVLHFLAQLPPDDPAPRGK